MFTYNLGGHILADSMQLKSLSEIISDMIIFVNSMIIILPVEISFEMNGTRKIATCNEINDFFKLLRIDEDYDNSALINYV